MTEAIADHLRRAARSDAVWDVLIAGEAFPESILGGKADCDNDTGRYLCCRAQGHPGQHVALSFFNVAAVWPQPLGEDWPPTLSPKDT